MSEQTLQRFLERLNDDAAFRESAQADPEGAFAEFGLSPAEQTALSSGDEDALRRLAGIDVGGFANENNLVIWGTWICYTPGSKKHCGTGQCATPGSGQGCGTGTGGGRIG